jgi:hypothetical protein
MTSPWLRKRRFVLGAAELGVPRALRAGGAAELSLWVFGLSGGAKLSPNKPFDPTNAPHYYQSIAIN